MNLQFFNPWIGRMNRQQFAVTTALCLAAFLLGLYLTKNLIVISLMGAVCGYMFFIFLCRRLADPLAEDIPNHLLDYPSSGRYTLIMSLTSYPRFPPVRPSRRLRFFLNRLSSPPGSDAGPFIFFFVFLPLFFIIYGIISVLTFLLLVLLRLVIRGYPLFNRYGYPPVGMDFRTTLPLTYPHELALKFDALQKDLEQRWESKKKKKIEGEE